MLFQVPNTQAYVLGSIHALPRGDNSLPGEVWRVAGQAKRLVFEVNLEQIPPSPPVAALEAGDSLRRYLPPQLYEATAALWVGLGGDLQLMDRLKVWRVSQLLMIHLIENHSEHTLSQGVDVQLWRSARQTGRTPARPRAHGDVSCSRQRARGGTGHGPRPSGFAAAAGPTGASEAGRRLERKQH